jgi:uncharacterized protein (DUF488 family)
MRDAEIVGLTVLTIGHSSHSIERFVELLTMHGVEEAIDTRSQPYSKHVPQFNRELLGTSLSGAGIRYLYLGDELGGRPRETEYYDREGHLIVDRVVESERFRRGINRLRSEIWERRLVLVCAEENPMRCHRRRLISPILIAQGILVTHIRGDGTVQSEYEISRGFGSDTVQMNLF